VANSTLIHSITHSPFTHAHCVADYAERCWVAAWGSTLERQREIDLPLVKAAECEKLLKPIFEKKEGTLLAHLFIYNNASPMAK
jgi:hypothetical protein